MTELSLVQNEFLKKGITFYSYKSQVHRLHSSFTQSRSAGQNHEALAVRVFWALEWVFVNSFCQLFLILPVPRTICFFCFEQNTTFLFGHCFQTVTSPTGPSPTGLPFPSLIYSVFSPGHTESHSIPVRHTSFPADYYVLIWISLSDAFQ